MRNTKAHAASLMLQLSAKNLSISDSAKLIAEASSLSEQILDGVLTNTYDEGVLLKHFLVKWLIDRDCKLSREELLSLNAEFRQDNIEQPESVVLSSILGASAEINKFMTLLFALGHLSLDEMEGLQVEYKQEVRRLVLSLLKDGDQSRVEQFIAFHIIERSLRSGLADYFKRIIQEGLIEQFLLSPLAFVEPLRVQVKTDLELAMSLADDLAIQ